jgi:predicted DNA-binding protein YlxM (UPF0122 family)
MKKIENEEQRTKTLEWMVKTASEIEHPLISEEEKVKKQAIYDHFDKQLQEYNEFVYKGSKLHEVPEEEKREVEDENKVNLSDWLDD